MTTAARSAPALLRRAASEDPGADAFVLGERRLTFAEWDRRSDAAAAAYARLGLAPGDVVALLLESGFDYPIAYLGALKAGIVCSGVNPRLGDREVERILDRSGARLLVRDDPARATPEGVRAIEPGELDSRAAPPSFDAPPGHPVAIVWTSGTTGAPKGATYTAGRLEAIRRIEAALAPSPMPRVLGGIPMAHMAFTTKIAASIERRTCTVLLGRWTAAAALEAIERERLTVAGGVPTQFALMLADSAFERTDCSSLREAVLGGAPATPALVRRIREHMRVPVTVRYSSTELGLATATRPGDPDGIVARTVGRPLPEVTIRIDGGGDEGEIVVRSPAMMSGYWRDETATRAAFTADGFFRTGDVGSFDEAGHLRISGRAKDMYIRGGYNVYPAEVEAALAEHPGVAQCAVVAYPDPLLGERGRAYVVPADPSQPPTLEDVRAFLASRIAGYKAPDALEVREHLPMSGMFKVDKKALEADGQVTQT